MGRGAQSASQGAASRARSQPALPSLTAAQASTLLALGYCLSQQIDSTREISANDQYAQERLSEGRSGGSTQRCRALEKKGLAEEATVFANGESNWRLTELGRQLYQQLKEERRQDRGATKNIYGLPSEHHWVARRLSPARTS